MLVVIDVWSPSCQAAIGDPLRHLAPRRTAVLSAIPAVIEAFALDRHAMDYAGTGSLPESLRTILSLGSFNRLAGQVEPWARRRDARFVVVQHGALTPWSPPLSGGTHLLAWTDEDAAYWAAGQGDVTHETVGSQLLWNAAHEPAREVADPRPVMLGQLHGTELPRGSLQRLYTRFCRSVGADYRPHPNEQDIVSRLRHRTMRRAGVQFEQSGASVNDLGRPVVSVFSTGTLEAAHRGIPAYVHHPDPPPWVRAFWERYGLAEFGGEPTRPLLQTADEPALTIAKAVGS